MKKIAKISVISAVLFPGLFLVFAKDVQAVVTVGQGYFPACATSNCTQSINLGFQPKAIFFYWTEQTNLAFGADASAGWGFAASTTASTPVQRAVSVASNDGDTTSENSRYKSTTKSIVILDEGAAAGALQRYATTTFTTSGFDVAWTTTTVTTGYRVHYLAIGGDDIVATDAGTFNLTTGTGSLSYNQLSFQPDFVMFAWTFTEVMDTITAGMEIGLGFATSSSAQGAILNVAADAVAANNNKRWQMQATSSIIATSVANPAVADAVVSFTQFDSNGFTVNKVDGPAAQLPVFFLAIKGGKHSVGFIDRPTSAQSVATTSPGFTPKSLLMMSTGATTTIQKGGSITADGGISLGSGTTTASSTAIWFQDYNVDSSDANMNATSSFIAIEAHRTDTDIRSRASLTSFDTGGFTLNWTPATSASSRWFYWAIGDLAVAASPPSVDTNTETNVTTESGTINGEITDTGGENATVRGFAWGTDSTLATVIATTTESGDFGVATFSQNLSGLLSGVTYYFRAYATNPSGTGFGSIDNFVTGTNTTPSRKMRLFEGYRIRILDGKIILHQQ